LNSHRLRSPGGAARHAGKKLGKATVLIVCEGDKTEPYYLAALCRDLRLNTVHVTRSHKGSSPISVFESAIERHKQDDGYDQIYCVFDRNGHESFVRAIQAIDGARERSRNPIQIQAIRSIPCFEYWILLHFVRTTKQFQDCSAVIAELHKYITNYEKGDEDLYHRIKDKLDTAIQNSEWVSKQQELAGTDDPTTELHVLIAQLRK